MRIDVLRRADGDPVMGDHGEFVIDKAEEL